MNLEDPEDASPTSGKRRKVSAHGFTIFGLLCIMLPDSCEQSVPLKCVPIDSRKGREPVMDTPRTPESIYHAKVRLWPRSCKSLHIEGWLDMPLAVQCSMSSQHVFLSLLQKRKPKQGAAQGLGANPESASQNQVDKQEAASR